MLRSLKSLTGYKLHAKDGHFGKVEEFFFDDEHWVVRYVVVNTGRWLTRNDVLISPISIRGIDANMAEIGVDLTKEEIENSPSIDTHKPVSREMELDYFQYYKWPAYWGRPADWWALGPYGMPYRGFPTDRWPQARMQGTSVWDEHGVAANKQNHLRSSKEMKGYRIFAADGEFGHVEDLIMDDRHWDIRYLVIDTVSYWPSKSVLATPEWVSSIHWGERGIHIDLPKEKIKNAPEYNPEAPVNREYEERLYDYYGRPKYWVSDHETKKVSGGSGG